MPIYIGARGKKMNDVSKVGEVRVVPVPVLR